MEKGGFKRMVNQLINQEHRKRIDSLVVRSPSIEEVNDFVNRWDIYSENSYDGCPERLEMPNSEEIEYNGLYANDSLVGLLILHPKDDGKEIHLSMVKGLRHLARKFVNHVLSKEQKVYAHIPVCKRSTINLAKKVGFQSLGEVGFFPKDGVNYPRELLCLKH